MAITIVYQKPSDSLNVAYRPVVFQCNAAITGATIDNYLPPVVYCDIYVNGVYYKTVSKTQFISKTSTYGVFEFDIQDAIQVIMSYNLPNIEGSIIEEFSNTIKKVYAKFRNAKFDANGFVQSEQLAPIQATSTNDAVDGEGEQSNEFYVINSTIQHEDNQEAAAFLGSFKTGTWDNHTFPLTKRPKVTKLCKLDSSFFPIVTPSEIKCLKLNYKLKGELIYSIVEMCAEFERILTIETIINDGFSPYFALTLTSNFPTSALTYEYSVDGTSWGSATDLVVIPELGTDYQVIDSFENYDFYIRVTDTNGSEITVSNIYHYPTTTVCPAVINLEYTITALPDNEADFEFTYELSLVVTDIFEIRLYYKITGEAIWSYVIVAVGESNAISITLNQNESYDFRFEPIGPCPSVEVEDLVGLDAIGLFGEFAAIVWTDTNTTEDRSGDDDTVEITYDGINNFDIESGTLLWEMWSSYTGEWEIIFDAPDTLNVIPSEGFYIGIHKFRLQAQNLTSDIVYSNELEYEVTGTIVTMLRSAGVNTSGTVCGQTLSVNRKMLTKDSSGYLIQLGDYILNGDETPFDGLDKWYLVQRSLSTEGDPSFGCKVNSVGRIVEITTCA